MRTAALDDGMIDWAARLGAAAAVQDDAGAGVRLEALLEVVEESRLGGGDHDEEAEFGLFRVQRRLPDVVARLTLTTRSGA